MITSIKKSFLSEANADVPPFFEKKGQNAAKKLAQTIQFSIMERLISCQKEVKKITDDKKQTTTV